MAVKPSLEKILQDIHKNYVKLKKLEKKMNNITLYSVLNTLLKKMQQCDNLFKSLKPKLEFLGSYFDGVRVGNPNEFDINVILTLHLNYNKIILDATNVQNGHTSVVMPSEFRRLSKTPATAEKGFRDTQFWCDASYRLSVTKFKAWMQSVVDATLNTLPQVNGKRMLYVNTKSYEIDAKISGPANTITIRDNDQLIDIDLVPTLQFKHPKVPINSSVRFDKLRCTHIHQYFIVPKPINNDYSWRLAFPHQERYYINGKNNLKSSLRIIKLLRDRQCFKKLASYYIKTLFLWEAAEQNDEFWRKNSLSYLVIYMLKKLRDSLRKREIKNFWSPDHNLLEKIKSETSLHWCNRLNSIIYHMENVYDPSRLMQYFVNI
ncbi:hypothetical protein K1T71_003128 [Dendrolimus kikuchii]|uniref:Uncharacterized protein n=1 Tax=Dendrolimus kikuchii TaxID=765133 RepID=A0ACC1DAR4_9NEOP|nr:hypothetical protein K1T71_003128 [Dendrolimus kikuchii]